VRTAIQIPSGGRVARFVERLWPTSFAGGAFILVCGDVAETAKTPPHNSMQPTTPGRG
jgi:hypothetical protein